MFLALVSSIFYGNKNLFRLFSSLIEKALCFGKVEIISRQFNHVIGKTVKGFTNLSLVWTDGISFIPVLNYLITSAKEKNKIMLDETKGKSRTECGVDKRTNSGKLRSIAVKTKPNVLIEMVKKAIKLIPAQYILMDSWTFSNSLIKQLYDLDLNTICLVKSNLQFSTLDAPDTPLSQKQLLKKLCNGKLRNANTLTSAIVITNHGT